jgi:hypothetical protein
MFKTRIAAVVATCGTVSLVTALGIAQTNTTSSEQAAPASGEKSTQPQPAKNLASPQPQQIPAQSAEQGSQAGVSSIISPAAPVPAAPRPPETNIAPVAPVPPEADRKEANQTTFPTKLFVTKDSWLQVGALLQGWFDTKWNSQIQENTSRGTQSTFRIRRAELKLSGNLLGDSASFMVSFDPAATYKYGTNKYTVTDNKGVTQTITTSTPPGNTAALKLFWVSLNSRYVDAAIGQFKYPMSYEGQSSSAELLFPERAYSSRYFGDTYDMGFRLEKKLDWFKYQVFLLNGSGQNQVDTNIQKDLSVRVELTPIPGMTLGAAGLTSLSRRTEQATTKDTGEFFGRLNTAGFLVQGELIWGKVGSTASGVERTKAAGRYATVGYTIAGKLQPVIRYGYLNTDKTVTLGNASTYALYAPFGVATDEVRSYEVGLNYYLQSNSLKLQAAYGYFDFDNVPALQEFTLSAQVAL